MPDFLSKKIPRKTFGSNLAFAIIHFTFHIPFAGTYCLNDALGQHRFSNFYKTCNIGAFHIVYVAILLFSIVAAGFVNAEHDFLQSGVHLLGRPVEADGVLCHFQPGSGHATGVGSFPRRE